MNVTEPRQTQVTRLIGEIQDGHDSAAERLLPLVYPELRALAADHFRGQRPDHTLQPTALVHEVFIRLVGNTTIEWEGKSHFFAVAARAMRNVLADHARSRRTAKRGGDWERLTLSGVGGEGQDREYDALDIHEALEQLTEWNERLGKIVELRFFAGLNVEEAAHVLGVAERTVRREWRLARAWLLEHLDADDDS